MARNKISRSAGLGKSSEPAAIVPLRIDYDTQRNLPLAAIARGSRGTIEAMLLNRLARAENAQRQIAEMVREAVDSLVTVELCGLVRDGVLVQCSVPLTQGKEKADEQRRYIRVRAQEVLAQGNSEIEPWFRPKVLSDAIMREVGLSHRRKLWPTYYSAYGCIVCHTTETSHFANGCCNSCWSTVNARIRKMQTEPAPRRADGKGRPRRAPYLFKSEKES